MKLASQLFVHWQAASLQTIPIMQHSVKRDVSTKLWAAKAPQTQHLQNWSGSSCYFHRKLKAWC